MLLYDKQNKVNSQALRKRMTDEEKKIWYDFFRRFPCPVKRQKCIGDYIVDFYIPSTKTVIEIDGSQHYEPENRLADSERDNYLSGLGITVLRYTNFDIKKRFDGVTSDILKHIGLKFEDLKFDRDALSDVK